MAILEKVLLMTGCLVVVQLSAMENFNIVHMCIYHQVRPR